MKSMPITWAAAGLLTLAAGPLAAEPPQEVLVRTSWRSWPPTGTATSTSA